MRSAAVKFRSGDVLEITLGPEQVVYARFVEADALADVLQIPDGGPRAPIADADLPSLWQAPSFLVYADVPALIKFGCARHVGHVGHPPPEWPGGLRRQVHTTDGGVSGWRVTNGREGTVVLKLNAEQRRLPIWQSFGGPELLLNMLSLATDHALDATEILEQDPHGLLARAMTDAPSDLPRGTITHEVGHGRKADAVRLKGEASKAGFKTGRLRHSPEDSDLWVVDLVGYPVLGSAREQEALLLPLVEKHRGQYIGHQISS